jgi:hypothetical protein
MTEKIGLDCKFYRNTGNYASPTWDEITIVRDLNLTLEKSEANLSSRASTWAKKRGALKDATIEGELIYDGADTDYNTLRSAFVNSTILEFAMADGAINTTNTQYFRAHMEVMSFGQNQPLEDGVVVPISFMPAPNANSEPAFVTVP